MPWIKILGISLIIISSSLIGVTVGENARIRVNSLVSLRRLLVILRGEMNYSLPMISDALEYIAVRSDDIWNMYFMGVSEGIKRKDIEDSGSIWLDMANSLQLRNVMYDEDIESLVRFGRDLSSFDKDSLIKRIDMYIQMIELRIDRLNPELGNKVKLCRMLGIIGGTFITIIII